MDWKNGIRFNVPKSNLDGRMELEETSDIADLELDNVLGRGSTTDLIATDSIED